MVDFSKFKPNTGSAALSAKWTQLHDLGESMRKYRGLNKTRKSIEEKNRGVASELSTARAKDKVFSDAVGRVTGKSELVKPEVQMGAKRDAPEEEAVEDKVMNATGTVSKRLSVTGVQG